MGDLRRITQRLPSLNLVRPSEKSHRITPGQPYNPHRFPATQPRGVVQQGSSALSQRSALPPITVAVRMKPYSLGVDGRYA
jgi:hypothetical protein